MAGYIEFTMNNTKNYWQKILIGTLISVTLAGQAIALSGGNIVQPISPNTVPNNSTPNIILAKGVTCGSSIISENAGSVGDTYAYRYKVKWNVSANQFSSGQNYSITYNGQGVLLETKYNVFDNPILNPYPVEATYSFKKTDPDKTVTLNVALTDYTVNPTKDYSGSCSIALKNKSVQQNIVIPFQVKEVTPVPTPGTNLSPSYTFTSTRAGAITYGGSCSSATTSATPGNNTIIFNNLSVGTYSDCTIKVKDNNNTDSNVLAVKAFTIEAPAANNSSSNSNQSSNNQSSSSNSSNDSTTSGEVEQSTVTQEKTLFPSPDILSCKARAKFLYFEFDVPAYDRMGIDCTLTKPAIIDVGVYKSYDAKSADNSANLLKSILLDKYQQDGLFYLSWDGYDDYDQAAALGEATFVIAARLADTYAPDKSLQKFTIVNAPGKGGVDETASAENVDNLKGSAPETSKADSPNVIESVANAIFGDKSPTAEVNTNREASKCPGVYYPTDIEKSPYKDIIRAAYDRCLVKGYEDGTFKPDQGLSRAEAAKIIVLGTGNVAKQGCYDADCGSPFVDLEMWQGPWIRAAYDLKMVVGVGLGKYAPNRQISRAEAVALVTKSFKIPAHQGCYTANCGAGYPDNFFKDIVHDWQGQYLRAAWDKKLITTVEPGKFYPDIPVSRGVFLDWTMKLVK